MKLSGIVVLAFFIMVSAIILAVGYSQYDPTMKEVASWVAYRDGLKDAEREFPKAVQRELDAEKEAQDAVNAWNQIAATRTLPGSLDKGGIDLSMNQYQLAIVIPTFRNSMQKMLNEQVKAGGVKVINGPSIPLPPADPTRILLSYFNYPGLPPCVIFDLGTVTVQGTYQQITDNIEAWSRMPHFLAVADGLRLQGTSPVLTATYAVSIVGFLQTDPVNHPIFPLVPEGGQLVAATPAAAPGTPGANPAGVTGGAGGGNPPTTGGAGGARVPVRPRTGAAGPAGAAGATGTTGTARAATPPAAGAGTAGAAKVPARPKPAGTTGAKPAGAAGAAAAPGTAGAARVPVRKGP
jgi:hypothetical protein